MGGEQIGLSSATLETEDLPGLTFDFSEVIYTQRAEDTGVQVPGHFQACVMSLRPMEKEKITKRVLLTQIDREKRCHITYLS